MSTNLQLCQYLRQETTDSGTGPSTVVGQSGEAARIVKWIHDAWEELQQDREDWRWMRKSFTVSATSGDGDYAYTDCTDTVTAIAIARWARWYKDKFKAYLTSDGVGSEYPLIWLEWDRFRRIYRYGTQTNSQPAHVSVDPTGKFVLGPIPDATYTVSGDYQLGPQSLDADGDVPEMPTRFHRLIVYEAMLKYGGNKIAPDAMARAVNEGTRLRDALELDQLPALVFGNSLV